MGHPVKDTIMPFVVNQSQQPQQPQQQPAQQPAPQFQPPRQPQAGRGGMNIQSMSPFQNRIGMQGGGQPLPRYGGGPLSLVPQRQPQFYGGGQQRGMMGPMGGGPMMRNPYQQPGGGRPMPWGYEPGDAYTKDMRFNYPPPQPQYHPPNPSLDYARDTMSSLGYGRGPQYQPQRQIGYANPDTISRQQELYSNRPQQGTYVGEGVYADGTPMPPQDPGPAAQPAFDVMANPYSRGRRGDGSGSTY